MDPYIYSNFTIELDQAVYEAGLVFAFDWPKWDEGMALWQQYEDGVHPALDVETCCKLLTTIIRADRFNAGMLGTALDLGIFQHVLEQLLGHLREQRK